jgi:nucleotide-binding universal stress UspA family protein
MPWLRRILFPIDYSGRSIAAARRVKALAEYFHSEVILLHVLAPLPAHLAALDLTSLFPESRAALSERDQRELGNFLDTELADLEVRRILAEGSPADAILQHAKAHAVDLIVMPTRGLDVLRRYVIGSVTAKVLHGAGIPVWTDDAARPSSRLIQRIICAVDLGPRSAKAITWASNLADRLNAGVTLVHVAPAPKQILARDFDPDRRWSLVTRAREQLQKVQEAVKTHWDMHIDAGEPAKDVVHAAGALKADLLVIGRSRHEGLMAGLRAHTYAIAGQSPCPVVSV